MCGTCDVEVVIWGANSEFARMYRYSKVLLNSTAACCSKECCGSFLELMVVWKAHEFEVKLNLAIDRNRKVSSISRERDREGWFILHCLLLGVYFIHIYC